MPYFLSGVLGGLLGAALFLWPAAAAAQNIEQLAAELRERGQAAHWLRLSGNAALEWRLNRIAGLPARADALALRGQAALLVDVMGVKAPISAAFSDGNITYRLPAFAFVGASPTYKWATLHIGDRSMNFSPYALAQHSYRGVGLELRPGKVYVAAFYGRLRRARPEDRDAIQNVEMARRRMGWGLKAGYDDGKNRLLAYVFGAKDDAPAPGNDSLQQWLPAQENAVVGIQAARRLGRRWAIEMEAARSALTRDRLGAPPADDVRGWRYRFGGWVKPRLSTGYHNAFKLKTQFSPIDKLALYLTYERIDPGYRSLGALFFNNDLESAALGGQLSLWESRLSLAAQGGLQRFGLAPGGGQRMNRLAASISVNARISERWQASGSWTNVAATHRLRLTRIPIVQVDSVTWVQTNANLNLNATRLLGPDKDGSLTVATSYQQARAVENEERLSAQESRFFSAMLALAAPAPENGWQWEACALLNLTQTDAGPYWMAGPSAGLSRSMGGGKWTAGLGGAWQWAGGSGAAQVWDAHADAGWQIAAGHTLVLRASLVRAGLPGGAHFDDWNAALRYGVQFKPAH